MSNSFAQTIKVSIDSYNRGRSVLPKKLANEAINHFKDNFRKQGFDDNVVSPWKPRKKRDSGRAILVKTGRLKRDWSSIQQPNRATVINNTPYGSIHNYGGKIEKKASSMVLNFRNRDNDWNKKTGRYNTGTRFSKSRTAHYSQKVNIGAHSIGMPQRKFMGKSRNLDEKSGVLISRMIKSAL